VEFKLISLQLDEIVEEYFGTVEDDNFDKNIKRIGS
jgi:hypothetical protein